MLADREEQALGALIGECLQHRRGVDRPRTVVEGQHDLLVGQEIKLLVLLEAEARTAGRVDLDHARDAQCIRIGAIRLLNRSRCRCRRGGDSGRLGGDRRGGLDVILGGEFGRRRQRIGGTGGCCLGGALVGARGIKVPTSGDHDRRKDTGQHQA